VDAAAACASGSGLAALAKTAGAGGTSGLLAHHQPSYEEVANVAVFAASDWARTMTATEINLTGGAVID
jgi:hypothetical protein